MKIPLEFAKQFPCQTSYVTAPKEPLTIFLTIFDLEKIASFFLLFFASGAGWLIRP
jgi:hypothetical protein